MNTVKYISIKYINWLTRRKKIQYLIMMLSVSLLTINNFASFFIKIVWNDIEYSAGSSDGNFITEYFIPVIGGIVFISAFLWLLIDVINEFRSSSRKKTVLIECDGLRKTHSPSLHNLVLAKSRAKLEIIKIDITQRIKDGCVIHPSETFNNNIKTITSNIATRIDGYDNENIIIAYGGFLPVPFTFYIGYILDDKGSIDVYDWDRQQEVWRIIDDNVIDDMDLFDVDESSYQHNENVVLAISLSYSIDLGSIKTSFPEYSLCHLSLNDIGFNNHWSLKKQQRLSIEFVEYVKKLSKNGVKCIHLVVAGQSSIILNLGRRYDHRNMPELIIYQYERTESNSYPWGVRISTHGYDEANVVFNNLGSS